MVKLKDKLYVRYQEEGLKCEGGEKVEPVAQRSCGYPIPGNIQGQTRRGPEKPGLVGDIPDCDRKLETR